MAQLNILVVALNLQDDQICLTPSCFLRLTEWDRDPRTEVGEERNYMYVGNIDKVETSLERQQHFFRFQDTAEALPYYILFSYMLVNNGPS